MLGRRVADIQFGEVDFGAGNTYLSYWVDYYLAHFFPSPPGADILQVDNTDSGSVEMLVRSRCSIEQ